MQHLIKLNLAISVVVLALISSLTYFAYQKVGANADDHGCCASCGFSWCEAKSKCVRPWQEPKSSPCAPQ